MNVQHWLLLLSATARIRSQSPGSSQPPLLPSRSRRRMPLQCPWMWRPQPILPHPLPSIHARASATLHDARGIPTRLVNPITPEDTRDSGNCLLRDCTSVTSPAARGGKCPGGAIVGRGRHPFRRRLYPAAQASARCTQANVELVASVVLEPPMLLTSPMCAQATSRPYRPETHPYPNLAAGVLILGPRQRPTVCAGILIQHGRAWPHVSMQTRCHTLGAPR